MAEEDVAYYALSESDLLFTHMLTAWMLGANKRNALLNTVLLCMC